MTITGRTSSGLGRGGRIENWQDLCVWTGGWGFSGEFKGEPLPLLAVGGALPGTGTDGV